MKPTITVAVTGGAGQIAYSLLPRIAAGSGLISLSISISLKFRSRSRRWKAL